MADSVEYASAIPCGAGMNAIQDFAEEFAESIGFEPGHPLEPIVSALGGNIVYQSFSELENSGDGSILIRSARDFTIYIADYTSHERDRFSIAHEIGHYLLHFPMNAFKPMKAARYGSTPVEWEANWFAAAFLMPSKKFRANYEELGPDIYRVAIHFDVSPTAALIRVKALNL